MRRLLLIAVSCLLAVLSATAAVPDKTKELVQKINPSLEVIEKQLSEIEADFWKNVRELDTGSHNFLKTNPLYQSFNQKIVDFVSCCGALQRVLYDSGVDVQKQYPIEKRAIEIISVARVSTRYGEFDTNGIADAELVPNFEISDPGEGVVYVVSGLIAHVLKRSDVVRPASAHPDCCREETEQIISVPRFFRIA